MGPKEDGGISRGQVAGIVKGNGGLEGGVVRMGKSKPRVLGQRGRGCNGDL